MALPTWIGYDHGIGDVVDDNGVVDVVVDHIVWRRRNVVWRVDIDGHRNVGRDRKNVRINGRRRRSQIDEVDRPRRQEKYRRWRRRLKSEIRIVENQYRTFDVNHLFQRWRRHVVADDFESRRRFESGRQICKPPPRIVGMEAAGVTAQIRPISRRRIDAPAASPRHRLAPGGNNGSHPSCHRIIGIGNQEAFIVLKIVAVEGCEIGIPGVQIPNRPGSDR